MHLVGEDQRRPNKGRLGVEQAFKRINNCVLAVQFGCFLTVLSLVSIAAGKTFESSFWGSGEIQFTVTIQSKLHNCSQNVTVGSAGFNPWPQTISADDHFFRFAYFAGRVKLAILLNGAAIILGAANKLAFDLNVFEVKIRHLIIRKELLTACEALFILFAIVSAAQVESDAELLQGYLKHCGVTSTNSLPYTPPFIALFLGLAWTLLFHCISFIILVYHTVTSPPPVPTTRNRFSQNLSARARDAMMVQEKTKVLAEDAIFDDAQKHNVPIATAVQGATDPSQSQQQQNMYLA